ncbi:MAG: redoxin domain-containing protein [Patescibacteria group bacterium]|jgi:peroxiredoxin (alkyl hydroperoxide reductase subunit C)
MPKINQMFPDFTLPAYYPKEDKEKSVSLDAFKGKWLIIFFYPADFTFVCPTELKDMGKHYAEFQKYNTEIMSVSTDTVFTHKAWMNEEKLLADISYPLAADHTGKLTRELGIFNEISGQADRAAYIIDPEGILQAVEIVAENIGRSAGEILRKLKALDYVRQNPGLACPASWEEGNKTLKPGLDLVGKVAEKLE